MQRCAGDSRQQGSGLDYKVLTYTACTAILHWQRGCQAVGQRDLARKSRVVRRPQYPSEEPLQCLPALRVVDSDHTYTHAQHHRTCSWQVWHGPLCNGSTSLTAASHSFSKLIWGSMQPVPGMCLSGWIIASGCMHGLSLTVEMMQACSSHKGALSSCRQAVGQGAHVT